MSPTSSPPITRSTIEPRSVPLRVSPADPDEPLRHGWQDADTGESAPSGVSLEPGPHGGVLLHWSVSYGAGIIHGFAFSTDGDRWEPTTSSGEGFPRTGAGVRSFAASDTVGVAAGTYMDYPRWKDRLGGPPDTAVILRSADGVTWRRALTIPDASIWHVAYVGGRYVAIGSRDTKGGRDGSTAWTSTDGLTWTEQPKATAPPDGAIRWRDRWLVVGDEQVGASHRPREVAATTTREGRSETLVRLGTHYHHEYNQASWRFAATEERYVALGVYDWIAAEQPRGRGRGTSRESHDTAEVWTTTDGKRWTRCASDGFYPRGLTAFRGRFVMTSDEGLLTSTNGCDWSVIADAGATSTKGWSAVASVNDRLVAITGSETGQDTNKGPESHFYAWVWRGE